MKTEFTTITLADQVEGKIIDYIKSNHLTPGDSLPNEMEFVEMMGISRNVVREAMSRLRMLGLIKTRPKKGITVAEPPLLNSFGKILDPSLLSVKTIKSLMGMRISLEIGIADFIFANINKTAIEELEQIVGREKLFGINNLATEQEMQFHMKIYEIAGNDFILQFQELMHPVFVYARQIHESYFKPINEKQEEKGLIIRHPDLLEIIKNNDKSGYQKAMRDHLQPYWEFIHTYENK